MELLGEPVVGLLDVGRGGAPVDAEDGVRVVLRRPGAPRRVEGSRLGEGGAGVPRGVVVGRPRGCREGAYRGSATAGAAFYPLVSAYLGRREGSDGEDGLGEQAWIHLGNHSII